MADTISSCGPSQCDASVTDSRHSVLNACPHCGLNHSITAQQRPVTTKDEYSATSDLSFGKNPFQVVEQRSQMLLNLMSVCGTALLCYFYKAGLHAEMI